MSLPRFLLFLLWVLLSATTVEGLIGTQTPTQHLWEGVGVLVGKVLKEGVAGCHLVLLSSASTSPLLAYVVRQSSEALLPATVLEVQEVVKGESVGLLKEVWASVKAPCRALFLDITRGAEESLGILEEAGLRLWPETRVVVLGTWGEERGVLLHHSFRNTRHALYIAPTTSTRHPLPRSHVNVTTTAVNTTQDSYNSAALQEVDTWVTILKRCLYCNESGSGVQLLYSGFLHVATRAVKEWAAGLFSRNDDQDLQGRRMRVVGLRYDPYSRYNMSPLGPSHPVIPLPSVDFSLLDAVSSSLNFTYEAKPPKVPQFGLPLGDGNWSGTVGTLQHEEADFSMVLSPTPGRMKAVDYSRVFMSESLCVLSPSSQALPQYLQLIKPLSGWVWTITAVIIVCWGVALWFFRKQWLRMEGVEGRGGLSHALLYSWGTMLGDSPAPAPYLLSGRVLFGGWMLFSVVVSTAYRSSLIAHLTILIKLPPIDSFEDLLARNEWTWGMKNATGSVTLYFTTASDPVRTEMRRKMQYHTLEEGMERLLKGRHSVIEEKFVALTTVRSRYTFESGYTPVHISSTTYPIFSGMAWGFRKGAPFRRSISLLKQRLIEAGLLDHWANEAVAATTDDKIKEGGGRHAMQESVQGEMEGDSYVVLSLQHLQGIFYLLGLGLFASCLAFAHELLPSRRPCLC